MTIAEYLHKEGRKEGLKEGLKKGIKKGIKEGRIATLRSLLVFKFQKLDAGSEARLQAATSEATTAARPGKSVVTLPSPPPKLGSSVPLGRCRETAKSSSE